MDIYKENKKANHKPSERMNKRKRKETDQYHRIWKNRRKYSEM